MCGDGTEEGDSLAANRRDGPSYQSILGRSGQTRSLGGRLRESRSVVGNSSRASERLRSIGMRRDWRRPRVLTKHLPYRCLIVATVSLCIRSLHLCLCWDIGDLSSCILSRNYENECNNMMRGVWTDVGKTIPMPIVYIYFWTFGIKIHTPGRPSDHGCNRLSNPSTR